MGFIRGALLFIAVVLLFLLFLVGNVFLILTLSLSYDNVQPELTAVIKDIAVNELNINNIINDKFAEIELYCENNSEEEFVFSEQEQTFTIPCEIVPQGQEKVINYSIENIVKGIYYEDYDCDFWDCFEKTDMPFFLVSAKAKDYWKSKFYFSLFVSLILIIAMFFLVEQKFNLPVLVGILLALSALPFMKLNWLLSFISDNTYMQFFTVFLSKAHTVFLITFILGLIILGFGLILKFFKIGFRISKFFGRFKKDKNKEVIKDKKSQRK